MFRRVSLALAIAAALAPLNVQSLGLGEIQSKSYLNQTLDADIELLSVDPDELDGIKASIASVEDFKRAGIDRPFVLNSVQFEPVRLPNGKVVIRAFSKDPIREPFLNFLVEVNWPKGRLLREYTVLLDPPVTLPRRPRPVAAPVASARPAVARARPAVARARPAVARAPSPEPTRQVAVSAPAVPGEYGPIQPKATLWSIAKGLQVEGATVEQVMMALLAQNPDAFIDGNINRLKAGEFLRVPGQEAAQELSRQQAREEFLQQLDDWQPAPKAEALTEAAASDEPADEAAPLPERSPTENAAIEEDLPEGQLKLASRSEGEEETVGGGLGAGVDEDLRQELLLAREESAVVRRESEELRAQVEDLESQVVDMQRLLSLQSDELARLQQARVTSTGISDSFLSEDLAGLPQAGAEGEGPDGMAIDQQEAGARESPG